MAYFGTAAASGNMTKLSDQLVSGSAVANITFASISQAYLHLLLLVRARDAGAVNNYSPLGMQVSGVTSANYHGEHLVMTGTGSTLADDAAATEWTAGWVVNGAALANAFASNVIYLPDYSTAAKLPSFVSQTSLIYAAASGSHILMSTGGTLNVAGAVTQILIRPLGGVASLAVGTRATLYGLN